LSRGLIRLAELAFLGAAACGPRAHIPPRPTVIPGALGVTDSAGITARSLAPLLYIQRDEWFPLERVVAVVHPTRPIIAYHLLWKDDVHGSWVPFTVPTDEEVVWVGYDSTRAPTDIWTFWHGRVLHTDWRLLPRRRRAWAAWNHEPPAILLHLWTPTGGVVTHLEVIGDHHPVTFGM